MNDRKLVMLTDLHGDKLYFNPLHILLIERDGRDGKGSIVHLARTTWVVQESQAASVRLWRQALS